MQVEHFVFLEPSHSNSARKKITTSQYLQMPVTHSKCVLKIRAYLRLRSILVVSALVSSFLNPFPRGRRSFSARCSQTGREMCEKSPDRRRACLADQVRIGGRNWTHRARKSLRGHETRRRPLSIACADSTRRLSCSFSRLPSGRTKFESFEYYWSRNKLMKYWRNN